MRKLAEREPQTALLADDRTIFLVAFQGGEPVGFVFGYVLPRRHGDPSILFVYELDVDEAQRRQGVGRRLMTELGEIAPTLGARAGFVLTEPNNDAANALYCSLGGERVDSVMWDFEYTAG